MLNIKFLEVIRERKFVTLPVVASMIAFSIGCSIPTLASDVSDDTTTAQIDLVMSVDGIDTVIGYREFLYGLGFDIDYIESIDFENLTDEQKQEFLDAGITEEQLEIIINEATTKENDENEINEEEVSNQEMEDIHSIGGTSDVLSNIEKEDTTSKDKEEKDEEENKQHNVTAGASAALREKISDVIDEEGNFLKPYYIEEYNDTKIRYISAESGLHVRTAPTTDDDDNIIDTLVVKTKVKVIGKVKSNYTKLKGKWVAIKYNGGVYYISAKYIVKDVNDIVLTTVSEETSSSSYSWSGTKLNTRAGRVSGPSGNETYYNDDMSYIVSRLKRMGYSGDYWVRSDGVKMFGDYILVAANFDIRPIGTILPTTLGMGIVADTGGFVSWDPTGLDIATTW